MPRFGAFDHSHRLFRKMKPLSLGGEAEGSKTVGDWSQVVHGLKGANLYVTGQHHGVYAACRARIPFVIFKLYNHKYPVSLNGRESISPLPGTAGNWLMLSGGPEGIERFTRRFNTWMERQPTWPGI